MKSLPGLEIGARRADVCIIQGGMSIRIARGRLAGAVAAEGGVGTIGGMGIPPTELRQQLLEARRATSGVVGVNLMYAGALFDKLLEVCVKERPDYVAIGAGFVRGPFKVLHEAGIPAFAIISSPKAARIAARTTGITGVVVESGFAGGHLGPDDPNISTWELFPEVHAMLKKKGFGGPIIAAGGLLNREDIDRALAMGADGVQFGTRFAVSEESGASEAMKRRWVAATGSQAEDWSPTGMPSRATVPHTPDRLPRLGENLKCQRCLKICMHREDHNVSHCIRKALINAQQGNVEEGLVFAGARIGEIAEVLPVKEIFRRLAVGGRELARFSQDVH